MNGEPFRSKPERTAPWKDPNGEKGGVGGKADTAAPPKRFHWTVVLDATRVGRDAGRIADEVIAHLAGLVGSVVTVTLEIDMELPAGVPEKVVHVVTEERSSAEIPQSGLRV